MKNTRSQVKNKTSDKPLEPSKSVDSSTRLINPKIDENPYEVINPKLVKDSLYRSNHSKSVSRRQHNNSTFIQPVNINRHSPVLQMDLQSKGQFKVRVRLKLL